MARSSAKRRSRPADSDTGAGVAPKLIWLAAAAGWAFLAAALLGFDRADPPTHAVWPTNSPPANWCGPVGAWLAAHAFKLLGWAIWLPMLIAGAGLVWTLSGRRLAHPVIRTAGTVILTVAFAGLLGLANPSIAPWPELPGGIGGLVGATELTSRFGALGSALWMIALALVGFIVAFDRLAWAVPALVLRQLGVGLGKTAGAGSAGLAGAMGRLKAKRAHRENDLDIDPEDEYADEYEEDEYEEDEDEGEWEEDDAEYEDEYEDEEAEAEPEPEPVVVKKPRKDKKRVRANLEPKPEPAPVAVSAASVASLEEDEEEDDELPGAPQVFTEEQIKEKIAALPVRFAGANRQLASEEDLRDLQQMGDMEGYQFPTLDLLEDPEEDFNETLEQLVREQGEALEAALREYKIKGEVVGIESGPVITLYDVRLAPGTKVAQLTSVQSDLARALKAVNIRVVANQVGRDTVGIEVPNPTKERVRLKELMSSRDRFQKMKLPMFLGKDASGDPLIADLSEMPHMLIAGTTGSGKSVCMNTIIMSFLYTRKPNELKLVLVDPKMVEMSQFKDIPHLMCPVVTEMTKAAAILEWACKKMDERYELLAEAGCRDIASYNKLEWEEIKERLAGPGETLSEEEAARIPKKLPYMVFVIDELADLMMTAKEVEGSIIRIAQKARAVGIHLILATQRPQANVVTGLIKSNMPCRVCFKVSSNIDSRVIMDQKGGELLLGQGDMLFLSPRTHKLQRAQGTLVDDHEIRRVVKFLKDIATPSFERQLIQLRATADEERLFESENHSSASLAAAQEDPLFDRAVEIVAETQRGSVSLLQRRLGIGYTRASRLIDLMGLAGLIGEHKGSVARAVMVTPEQWAQVKEFAEQETGASFPSAAGVETPEDDADRQMAFDELTAGPVADSAEEPPFVVNDAPSEPASDKPVSEDLGPDNEPGDEPNNPPDPDADQGPEGRAPSEPIADADADVEIEAKPDETLTDDDLAESIEGDPSDDADEEGEDEEWDETGEYVDEGEEDEEDEEEESDDAEAAADDEGEDEEGEEEEEEEEEGEYEYEYEYEYVDEEEDADAEEDDGDDSGEEEDGEESDDAVSEADEPDRAKITVKSSSDATVEDPTEAAPGRAG